MSSSNSSLSAPSDGPVSQPACTPPPREGSSGPSPVIARTLLPNDDFIINGPSARSLPPHQARGRLPLASCPPPRREDLPSKKLRPSPHKKLPLRHRVGPPRQGRSQPDPAPSNRHRVIAAINDYFRSRNKPAGRLTREQKRRPHQFLRLAKALHRRVPHYRGHPLR